MVLTDLATSCLESAVADQEGFRFRYQGPARFLEPLLMEQWVRSGRQVLRPEATTTLLDLVVTVDQAAITMKRAKNKNLDRHAMIALSWWLNAPDGSVLESRSCRESAVDLISRSDAESMAVAGDPVRNPALPPSSRWRSWVEPVVLTGATVVGTYLLFNLRSRRADSG